MFPDVDRGLHAVHRPLEDDIHHDQIRAEATRFFDSIRSAQGRAHNLTTEMGQVFGDIMSNDGFIVYDEDAAIHQAVVTW